MGQQWPAAGLGTLSVAVYAWDLLKEVAIIFITSTIVWPQVNNSTEELMLLNYGVGEDSWKSLGLQGDPTSPS